MFFIKIFLIVHLFFGNLYFWNRKILKFTFINISKGFVLETTVIIFKNKNIKGIWRIFFNIIIKHS